MEGDRTQIIQDCLTKSGIPRLQDLDSSLLEATITPLQIKHVIKLLNSGKSPDPDSYSAIYYNTFSNILTEQFTAALNSMSTPREITPDVLSAHIAMIPKVGKDPTDCASYHPISILNLDGKLFAKILALPPGTPSSRSYWSRTGGFCTGAFSSPRMR